MIVPKRIAWSAGGTLGLAVCMALLAVSLTSACRLTTGTVACERDRDCPADAGLPFCTSWDAGLGTCTSDGEFFGDTLPTGGDIDTTPGFPDGGMVLADAGSGDGGLPALP